MSVQIKTEDGWKKVAGNINPSEIEAVNARIDEYEQSGFLSRNLLDMSLLEVGKSWNGASNTKRARISFEAKSGQTITISINDAISSWSTCTIRGMATLNDLDSSASIIYDLKANKKYTLTVPATTKYIQIMFEKTTDLSQADFSNIKLQIEEGTVAHAYTPFAKPNTELTEIVAANYSNGFLSDCLAEKGQIIVGKSWVLANASDRAILNVDVEPNTEYTISIGNMAVDAINYIEKTDAESKQAIYTNTITGPLTRTTSATTKVMCIQFSKASITLADVQNCVVRVDKGKQRVPSNTELQNAINTMLVTKSVTNSAVIEIGAYSSTSFNINLPTDVDYSNYNLVSVLPTSVSYGATVTWASITNNILTVNLGNARASAVSIPSGNFKANILLAIK